MAECNFPWPVSKICQELLLILPQNWQGNIVTIIKSQIHIWNKKKIKISISKLYFGTNTDQSSHYVFRSFTFSIEYL